MVVRNVVAAGAAAFAFAFSVMDANPSLYIHDKIFVNDKRMRSFYNGKTMWILGASSGVGEEMARQLSSHGANLILSARSVDKLNSVAESCKKISKGETSVRVLPFDISAPYDELESVVDTAREMLGNGTLDILVLNAGIGQLEPASTTSHLVTQQLFNTNTLAPIAMTHILLNRGLLGENASNHLVVTSSVGGKLGLPLSASYAASKHALHGYYDSLQAECPWLRVDMVCPGPVDTSFHKQQTTNENTASSADDGSSQRSELKMPVSRCSALILSGITMRRGGERWVAEQPTLLGLYLKQHIPGLFDSILRKVGPLRLKAWKEGKNLYDPETWKNLGRRKRD